MISIDGYYPLSAFVRAARNMISRRLWRYYLSVNESSVGDEDEVDMAAPIKVERSKYWAENIEIAAQFLVHDVMRRSGEGKNRAYILRPDGSRMAVQQKVTEPLAGPHQRDSDYQNHRNWRIQDDAVDRGELVFGVDTFKDDFWLEYFTRDRIFYKIEPTYRDLVHSGRRHLPVVNWGPCIIDVSTLKAVCVANEHLIAARLALQRVGCAPPRLLERYADGGSDGGDIAVVLRMFEPYDGCPIILHEACWKGLDEITAREEPAERNSTSPVLPTEAITAILDSEGSIGKSAIRERIATQFPGVTARKFDHFWNLVATDRPEIRKAGRKSKQRIETQN